MRHLILFFFLSSIACGVFAQQAKVSVVSKKIQKTFPAKAKQKLNISASLADIRVVAWDKPEIQMEVTISAKHSSKEKAVADIAKMEFVAMELGKDLYARNYITLAKNQQKPESSLKAEYVVYVPKNCPIFIEDQYGKVEIVGLRADIDFKGSFASLKLHKTSGRLNIDAYYGDIEMDDVYCVLYVKSNRSNITANRFEGQGTVNAEYASINLSPGKELVSLNVNAKHSNVVFNDKNAEGYRFELVADNGKIQHPSTMRFKLSKKDNQSLAKSQGGGPMVSISTTNGDITILR